VDERELVERLKKGDRVAQEYLVRVTQDFLFNSLLQVCHDRHIAEDIVIETYINAFRYIKGFKGESRIETWLYRIARNELKKYFDKMNRVDLRDDLKSEEKEAYFLEDDRKDMLYEAMGRLDVHEREIITLVDVEGLSYEEVRDLLAIPLGTVKSRLTRAREKLRSILKEFGYF